MALTTCWAAAAASALNAHPPHALVALEVAQPDQLLSRRAVARQRIVQLTHRAC